VVAGVTDGHSIYFHQVTFSEQVEVKHHRVSDSDGQTHLNIYPMLIGCLGFNGAFNTDTHLMASFVSNVLHSSCV